MSQNYFSARVKAKKEAIVAVEFALLEAGAEGTELDLLGKNQAAESVSVVGYFAAEPNREIVESWLSSALEIYELPIDSIAAIEVQAVENQDWSAEWKKHWRPTETNLFTVAPSWFELPEGTDKIVLRIEPGMAFGTGTHETTQLCLQAIEGNYKAGMSFLDVGTGTGVLAIAAAKIRSKVRSPKPEVQSPKSKVQSIVACDIDEDSVNIAVENAEINDVAEQIKFYFGSINEETPKFDFVTANLTADVIVPLLPLLTQKFRKTLVLSGVLFEQQAWVVGELDKSQIKNPQIERSGEWVSVLIKK